MSELLALAAAHKCSFPPDFAARLVQTMTAPGEPSTMYQDFTAKRPMEVETYLGSPVKLAKAAGIAVPRLETLYAMMRHVNATNKDRSPPPPSPAPTHVVQPPPRTASMQPPPRQMNGPMAGGPRPPRGPGGPMGPPGRRGPPPVNGFRGYPGQNGMQRRPSFDENGLDEFSHVVLYDEMPDGEVATPYGDGGINGGQSMRERELMLREKELHLKQQEMAMRNRGGGRRPSHNRHQDFDDDEDDDDFVDPMIPRYGQPPIDDNVDMMSVTSRRTKRHPSQGQLRRDMYGVGPPMRGAYNPRPHMNRNRTSAQLMSDMPALGENILDNPMMGFSSNRYGTVDRKEINNESRTNSLTAARLNEMGVNGGPYPGAPSRRTSRSPGNPFGPTGRPMGRPSPPHDPSMQHGPPRGGRPSPPGGMPAPTPRYPPGQGNAVHPHQVEQQAGVSKPYPPKAPAKSLTGSASASAGSGDSGSANIESEPSAHSSQSSFAPRPMMTAAR
jgi:hypothetical protein